MRDTHRKGTLIKRNASHSPDIPPTVTYDTGCHQNGSSLNDLSSCSKALDPGPHAVACNTHFGINNYFLFSNMASFFFNQWTSPDAKIGLWTLRPPSSAVFPHPEPAIPFILLVSGFPPTSCPRHEMSSLFFV